MSAVGENMYSGAVWVVPGGASGPVAKGTRFITAAAVNLPQGSTFLGGWGLMRLI
ncbi:MULTISPECIES: hypothetical protein [unclassified Streptomyces]|uniref:hypothetical protein n=1 Tax=unclassified Streptomyces TaxID=2593676 RepID=UPI0037FA0305